MSCAALPPPSFWENEQTRASVPLSNSPGFGIQYLPRYHLKRVCIKIITKVIKTSAAPHQTPYKTSYRSFIVSTPCSSRTLRARPVLAARRSLRLTCYSRKIAASCLQASTSQNCPVRETASCNLWPLQPSNTNDGDVYFLPASQDLCTLPPSPTKSPTSAVADVMIILEKLKWARI